MAANSGQLGLALMLGGVMISHGTLALVCFFSGAWWLFGVSAAWFVIDANSWAFVFAALPWVVPVGAVGILEKLRGQK